MECERKQVKIAASGTIQAYIQYHFFIQSSTYKMNEEINPLSVESFDKMPFFPPINLVAANNGRK